jgi:hypothetical protein
MIAVRSAPAKRAATLLACLPLATLASGAGTIAAASAATRSGTRAAVSRACPPPHYPGVGYFTELSVTDTTCKTGSKLVLAYYKCRTKSGPAGRCRGTVLGFRCTEQRNSIPTEIDALDTCRHGHEKVASAWQQDTD